jgi:hypothetical protein
MIRDHLSNFKRKMAGGCLAGCCVVYSVATPRRQASSYSRSLEPEIWQKEFRIGLERKRNVRRIKIYILTTIILVRTEEFRPSKKHRCNLKSTVGYSKAQETRARAQDNQSTAPPSSHETPTDRADRHSFPDRVGRIFLFATTSRPALGPAQPFIKSKADGAGN